jgi:hypothetical protein
VAQALSAAPDVGAWPQVERIVVNGEMQTTTANLRFARAGAGSTAGTSAAQ